MTTEIDDSLKKLSSLEEEVMGIAKAMLLAGQGKQYPFDLFTTAVLDRTLSLINGYVLLVRNDNFRCAAHLIRLHLDNYLRLNAAWLVDDPQQFALDVINGVQIKDIKDKDGNKMHDGYLVNSLLSEHPSLKEEYARTSGYVHLSRRHFLSSNRLVEGQRVVLPFRTKTVT